MQYLCKRLDVTVETKPIVKGAIPTIYEAPVRTVTLAGVFSHKLIQSNFTFVEPNFGI